MVCNGTRSGLLRLSLILVLGLFSSEVNLAQEAEKERQLAEQLLELEDAIEELLADLPPDARDRVRALARALRAQASAPPAAAPARDDAARAVPKTAQDDTASTTEATLPPETSPEVATAEAEADVATPREEAAPEAPEPVRRPPTEESAATPSVSPSTTEAEALPEVAPEPDVTPSDEPDCLPLARFDTSEDGVLSGADRLWRHFYLKTDLPKDDGVVSLFELDIRSVALDVETYGVKGDAEGYVQRTSKYRFQIIGKAARRVRDGFLAVDASGLSRNGTVRLLDASGNELEGVQVLEAGQTLVFADGEKVSPLCR